MVIFHIKGQNAQTKTPRPRVISNKISVFKYWFVQCDDKNKLKMTDEVNLHIRVGTKN